MEILIVLIVTIVAIVTIYYFTSKSNLSSGQKNLIYFVTILIPILGLIILLVLKQKKQIVQSV
jgi:hypothetical protein